MQLRLGAIFLTILGAGIGRADLVPFHEALADACLGRTSSCELGATQQLVPNGTAEISANYGSAAAQAQMTAHANATSRYGVLGAGASSTINISGAPALAESVGDARFQDVLTVSYAPFTGRTGLLFISYTLNGTISKSGQDNSFTSVRIGVGPSLEQQYTALYTSSTSGLFSAPKFTFTYGTPFGLYFDLITGTGTITPVSSGGGFFLTEGTGSGVAEADFFNTLVLSDLTLADEFGNVVTGAQFDSASGTQYGPNGLAQVPEPRFLLLLGSALVMICLSNRRQKVLTI
jgi:hypothetical protein